MTIPCPHCGRNNIVAGLYRSNAPNPPRGEIPCIACERRFNAVQQLDKPQPEANGKKVGS